MMTEKFREIIRKRADIDDESYVEVEKCWEEMVDIFSSNINETILFINKCTEDEFSWLSEIFDRIAEKTHSKEFIITLYKVAEKYPEETEKYNIVDFIKSAECLVENS